MAVKFSRKVKISLSLNSAGYNKELWDIPFRISILIWGKGDYE